MYPTINGLEGMASIGYSVRQQIRLATSLRLSGRRLNVARRWASLVLASALAAIALALIILRVMGYHMVSTRGESMEPAFSYGSLLITRSTVSEHVSPGDIVVFSEPLENKVNIVHRVISLETKGGRILAQTKGDHNPAADPFLVPLDKDVQVVMKVIPYVGLVSAAATPAMGWNLIGLAALLGARFLLHKRPKKLNNPAVLPLGRTRDVLRGL